MFALLGIASLCLVWLAEAVPGPQCNALVDKGHKISHKSLNMFRRCESDGWYHEFTCPQGQVFIPGNGNCGYDSRVTRRVIQPKNNINNNGGFGGQQGNQGPWQPQQPQPGPWQPPSGPYQPSPPAQINSNNIIPQGPGAEELPIEVYSYCIPGGRCPFNPMKLQYCDYTGDKFMQCNGGTWTVKFCPPGTTFKQGRCRDPRGTIPLPYNPQPRQTFQPPPPPPQPQRNVYPPPPQPQPQPQQNTWQPNPNPQPQQNTWQPQPQNQNNQNTWQPQPQNQNNQNTWQPQPQNQNNQNTWQPQPQNGNQNQNNNNNQGPYNPRQNNRVIYQQNNNQQPWSYNRYAGTYQRHREADPVYPVYSPQNDQVIDIEEVGQDWGSSGLVQNIAFEQQPKGRFNYLYAPKNPDHSLFNH